MIKTTRIIRIKDSAMGWNFTRRIYLGNDGFDVIRVQREWVDLDVLRDLVDRYIEEDSQTGRLISLKGVTI